MKSEIAHSIYSRYRGVTVGGGGRGRLMGYMTYLYVILKQWKLLKPKEEKQKKGGKVVHCQVNDARNLYLPHPLLVSPWLLAVFPMISGSYIRQGTTSPSKIALELAHLLKIVFCFPLKNNFSTIKVVRSKLNTVREYCFGANRLHDKVLCVLYYWLTYQAIKRI